MSIAQAMVLVAFIVVGLPVILGIGMETLKIWLRHRERQMEITAERTAEKAAQYAAQVERLEQRMRVLERIAVDGGNDLAMQIEDLRDAGSKGSALQ